MSRLLSKGATLAIKQPVFVKPETHIKGGLALISQRTETIAVDLVMDYMLSDGTILRAGTDKAILRGESGLTAWAKKLYTLGEKEYVICPDGEVLGFVLGDK